MGLRYLRAPGGPNCFESPDVRVIDGERDIPYHGTLVGVVAATDSDRDCHTVGVILDDQTTLLVDCLHDASEIDAFKASCRKNGMQNIVEVTTPIMAPCPPPKNQAQLGEWRAGLFRELHPNP